MRGFSHLRICTVAYPSFPPLRNGGNFIEDAESAKYNRKNNIKIFRFLFFELSWNLSKIEVMTSQNDTKMTITRKIKIVKTWKLVFPSIQPILDYSCKFEKWILRIWAKKFSIFFCGGIALPASPHQTFLLPHHPTPHVFGLRNGIQTGTPFSEFCLNFRTPAMERKIVPQARNFLGIFFDNCPWTEPPLKFNFSPDLTDFKIKIQQFC